MPIHVAAQRQFFVGQPFTLEGVAPQGQFSAVFEDDGETGYFYALDRAIKNQPIQDAVHIYNVQSVTDRAQPSTAKIGWSADFRKAVLLINDYPHAVFDFEAQQGYCRSGFPPPGVGPAARRTLVLSVASGEFSMNGVALARANPRCPASFATLPVAVIIVPVCVIVAVPELSLELDM